MNALSHLKRLSILLFLIAPICARGSAQNLFVADGVNIVEFTSNGARNIFASGLSGAIAFDKAGNLFVANGAGKIYKLTPNGVRTTFASGLDYPIALAFDSAGNLFVTTGVVDDYDQVIINGSGKIHKVTPSGVRTTFATGLDILTDLAFDSAGNLFVANESTTSAIYKFTPAGVRSTFASGLIGQLAFDKAGNLF